MDNIHNNPKNSNSLENQVTPTDHNADNGQESTNERLGKKNEKPKSNKVYFRVPDDILVPGEELCERLGISPGILAKRLYIAAVREPYNAKEKHKDLNGLAAKIARVQAEAAPIRKPAISWLLLLVTVAAAIAAMMSETTAEAAQSSVQSMCISWALTIFFATSVFYGCVRFIFDFARDLLDPHSIVKIFGLGCMTVISVLFCTGIILSFDLIRSSFFHIQLAKGEMPYIFECLYVCIFLSIAPILGENFIPKLRKRSISQKK